MSPEGLLGSVTVFERAARLREVSNALKLDWPWPSSTPRQRFDLLSAWSGLNLTVFGMAPQSDFRDADDLVMCRLEFWPHADLPRNLDWGQETHETAIEKLGPNTSASGAAVSHFQPDGGVFCLYFRPGGLGPEKVLFAKLGQARDGRAG